MFDVAWSILGTLLILVALVDAFWTTLTVSRAGWLSKYLAGSVGRMAMKGPRSIAENASLLALSTSFLLWCLLLWVGWTLFFCGSPEAVLKSSTQTSANLLGRFYFAGFTITTLGIGDLEPGEGIWRLGTVLAAASGFIGLTLFITYAISVMSALNNRRALGAGVGQMGPAPEDFLLLIQDGGSQALSTRLLSFVDQLESAAIQTDTYPVLEFSHVDDPKRSFARAVVTLGEVSLLLEHVATEDQSLPRAVWQPLREAVSFLIREKHSSRNSGNDHTPPPPDFEHLRRRGIPIKPNAAEAYQCSAVQSLRSRWASWLRWHHDDWESLNTAARGE